MEHHSICKDIKQKPKTNNITNIGSVTTNFRVLPLYEKTFYENSLKNYYSLEANEVLKCKWSQYVNNIRNKAFTPFWFPDGRDEHFHNQNVQWIPSDSVRKRSNFGYNFGIGPGVDRRGNPLLMPYEQNIFRPSDIKPKVGKDKEKEPGQTETLKTKGKGKGKGRK